MGATVAVGEASNCAGRLPGLAIAWVVWVRAACLLIPWLSQKAVYRAADPLGWVLAPELATG